MFVYRNLTQLSHIYVRFSLFSVNGYKVSPRGRGHDSTGLSSLDGSLVIDMQLNCKLEDFLPDKTVTGDHIVPGSKYIGTMKAPSGCTNSVFLTAVDEAFKDVGGMNVCGSCPSVGITGYILNGLLQRTTILSSSSSPPSFSSYNSSSSSSSSTRRQVVLVLRLHSLELLEILLPSLKWCSMMVQLSLHQQPNTQIFFGYHEEEQGT